MVHHRVRAESSQADWRRPAQRKSRGQPLRRQRAILCDGSVRPVSISQTFAILPFSEHQVSYLGRELQRQWWFGFDRGDDHRRNVEYDPFVETATAPRPTHLRRGSNSPFPSCPDGRSNTIQFSETSGAVGPSYVGLDDVSVIAVPEPSTWALALLGFAGWACRPASRTPRDRLKLTSARERPAGSRRSGADCVKRRLL